MLRNSVLPVVINNQVAGTTKQLPTIGEEKFLPELCNSNFGSHVALLSTRAGLLTSRR
jgi:hypothetical protein